MDGLNEIIERELKYDALSEAEKITGDSYKESKSTALLGLALQFDHVARSNALMTETNDTPFSCGIAKHLALYEEFGFEKVYEEHFDSRWHKGEVFHVWFQPQHGILSTIESFRKDGRNSCKIYYNFRNDPDATEDGRWAFTSSGGWTADPQRPGEFVHYGHRDMREGFRYHMNRLLLNVEFVTPWVQRPFLWLLNYSEESKGANTYEAINSRKIAAMPEHVQNALGPNRN